MYVYRLVYTEFDDGERDHHVMTFSRAYPAETLSSKLNELVYAGKFKVERDLVSGEFALLDYGPDDDTTKDAGG